VMLPGPHIAEILRDLEKEGRDQTRAAKDIDPAIVQGIAKALELLGDGSMLSVACGCYDSFRSEPLRDVLLAYIRRWVKGNEKELAGVIQTAGVDLGLLLVRLLGEIPTPEAALALDRANANPHLSVRIEALARMPADKEDLVRGEVEKMLDAPAASVRMEALKLIAARELRAAGPALVFRAQAPAFHEMPAEERRQWLNAIASLNPRRAEALCAALLSHHTLIQKESVEVTRALAADILVGMSSDEALAAAQEGAKKRWWNSQAVREASERALNAIMGRRAAAAETPPATKRKADTS
jgi:eukaryotic-like serine/threonine-protein kinase